MPTQKARGGERVGGRFTSGGKTERGRQVQSPDERPEVSRREEEERRRKRGGKEEEKRKSRTAERSGMAETCRAWQ